LETLSLRDRLTMVLERLSRRQSVALDSKVLRPVPANTLKELAEAARITLPPELEVLYSSVGGTRIAWRDQGDQDLYGTLDLLPPAVALLGPSRGGAGRDRFRGVLWNEEFADHTIAQLRRHIVIESVAGDPAFITFCPRRHEATAYLVVEESIKPMRPGFSTCLDLLVDYLGAGDIRTHMTKRGWRRLIADDPILQRTRALLGEASP
jgi:hypothetical protein